MHSTARRQSQVSFTPTTFLARVGEAMRRHRRLIIGLQWVIVVVYIALLLIPVLLPLPDETAHIWNNFVVLAQWLFWGIWWPFVLLSMLLLGRMWCGVLCPEGTLTEWASKHGLNRAIPRWLRWGGWPFVGFAGTTLFGQMVSVYQYPLAAMLVLGGSTVAAIGIGLLYGREKRVWCMYLCPVNGVFGLLAKLAPVHFKSDPTVWKAAYGHHIPVVNCAPLIPLRNLNSSSACHSCGRCSGHRGAIALTARAPNDEIVHQGRHSAKSWQTFLLLFGMIGLAMGAFHWSASPWLIEAKQMIATRLIEHDIVWPLEATAPWWLLTHYPEVNDAFSWLDGGLLIAYILLTALLVSGSLYVLISLARGIAGRTAAQGSAGAAFNHLAQAFIPLAACGLFLGLSSLTVSLLKADGFGTAWVPPLRIALLAGASVWTLWLSARIVQGQSVSRWRANGALLPLIAAIGVINGGWYLLFWGW